MLYDSSSLIKIAPVVLNLHFAKVFDKIQFYFLIHIILYWHSAYSNKYIIYI